MKFTRRVLLLLFLFTTPILTFSRDMSKKENIDVKEILWGHIKDSYEWHITDRPGPYNLVIKSGDDKVNPNLIVEKIGNKEVRPIDLL